MLFRFTKTAIAVTVGACLSTWVTASWAASEVLPVQTVLARLEKSAAPIVGKQSEGAKFLKELADFRSSANTLPPDRAAKEWLLLWDRAVGLKALNLPMDYSSFDIETSAPVGLRSVIAALPGPVTWPIIRAQALARKDKSEDDSTLVLNFLVHLLNADKAGIQRSLAALDRSAGAKSPEARESMRYLVDGARSLFYKLYGSRDQIAQAFQMNVNAQSKRAYSSGVEVPDLVNLLGAARAEVLLREALANPVLLHVPEGDATRALARKIALVEIAKLRKPQWNLVDDVGTAPLYEALQKRFDPVNTALQPVSADDGQAATDYLRAQADIYYMLDMIIAGRQEEAQRAMKRATRGEFGLSIPKQAIAALKRAGKNVALYNFLAVALERQPQLQLWDALVEQAGYLGRGIETIALFEKALARNDLPPYLLAELRVKRLNALLASDRIDEAVAGFREVLVNPPQQTEHNLSLRTKAAIKLASLGRVLKQPELSEIGFGFAKSATDLIPKIQSRGQDSLVPELLGELRRQGRDSEAQQLALTASEFSTAEAAAAMASGYGPLVADPAKRFALIELAGIYDSAGRHLDVLQLLNDSAQWGTNDIKTILGEKDSMNTPLGMMAARALNAAGEKAAANTVVRALLDELPGHDPAYQLLVELSGADADLVMDKLYTLDQFEERPLIWKAIALNAGRQYAGAEQAARKAIKIDPSDGEQGPNDRMRVYSALADSLEGQGDFKSAKTYRGAVAAIRKSERADEFYKLGLYQQAFAGYRAALDDFSDAYCIQSRLAVQLGKVGLHKEALQHFQRAYELMPDSFGRVESHCFGCESVFSDDNAQNIADKVFTEALRLQPSKPQASYMLGYLREQQGRFDEAVKYFRQAAALDGEYLNAWKHLQQLGEKTYIDPTERDTARLKLFTLDPRQRHVRYQLNEVADLLKLWGVLDQVSANALSPNFGQIHSLAASARAQAEFLAKMPVEVRAQFENYKDVEERMRANSKLLRPGVALAQHALVKSALQFLGDRSRADMDD